MAIDPRCVAPPDGYERTEFFGRLVIPPKNGTGKPDNDFHTKLPKAKAEMLAALTTTEGEEEE
jgi:hypothetical protein